MARITREQAAILSAHTGILCGPFSDMHKYVERIMGRPVFTHEMGSQKIADEIKKKSWADFISLTAEDQNP
jgi:hypothetical protein